MSGKSLNPLVAFIGQKVRVTRTVGGKTWCHVGLVRKAWSAGDRGATSHGAIVDEATTSGGFDCSAILAVEPHDGVATIALPEDQRKAGICEQVLAAQVMRQEAAAQEVLDLGVA